MTSTDNTFAQQIGFSLEDARRLVQFGCDLLESADLDGAKIVFESLLVINPHDAAVRAALGAVLEQQGNIDDAEAAYSKAIVDDANCELARLNRGTMRLRKGDAKGRADLMVIADRPSMAGQRAQTLLARWR